MRDFFLLMSVGWMLCMNWRRLRRYQCLQEETLISNSARRQHSKLYWHLWQICKGEGKKKERKWRKKIKQMRDWADIHLKIKGGPIDCSCQDKLPSTNRFSGWSLLGLGGACEHEDRRCCCSEGLERRQSQPHDNGMTSAEKCHWGHREFERRGNKTARIFGLWLIYKHGFNKVLLFTALL